jgi:hypothetical protein
MLTSKYKKSEELKSWDKPLFLVTAEHQQQFWCRKGKGNQVLEPTQPPPQREKAKKLPTSLLETKPEGPKKPIWGYKGHQKPFNTFTTHNTRKFCGSVATRNRSCSQHRSSAGIRTSTILKRSRDLKKSNFFKKINFFKKLIAIKKLIVIKLIWIKKLILIKNLVTMIAKHKNLLLNPQPSNETQDGPKIRVHSYVTRENKALSLISLILILRLRHKNSLLNPQPSNDAQDGPQTTYEQEFPPLTSEDNSLTRNRQQRLARVSVTNRLITAHCTTLQMWMHELRNPSLGLFDMERFQKYNLAIRSLPRIFHTMDHSKKWGDFVPRLLPPPPDQPEGAEQTPPNRHPFQPITSRTRGEVADTHNDHPPIAPGGPTPHE